MNNYNYTLLDNVTHKDLRVVQQYRAGWGDNMTSVAVFATELNKVTKHYPVLFYPDAAGENFSMVALLGLENGENLFLTETLPASYENLRAHHGWAVEYVPAMIARGPFAIGMHGDGHQLMVHIDENHPKLSYQEGKPLFLPKGGNSRYLEQVASLLNVIHTGIPVTQQMTAAWRDLGLLEPLTVDIELSDGTRLNLAGYYAVSEEKVAALDAPTLHSLHRQGFLQGLFLVLTSLSNIQTLVDLKNIRKQHNERAYS